LFQFQKRDWNKLEFWNKRLGTLFSASGDAESLFQFLGTALEPRWNLEQLFGIALFAALRGPTRLPARENTELASAPRADFFQAKKNPAEAGCVVWVF
jgi:hypothetical protein